MVLAADHYAIAPASFESLNVSDNAESESGPAGNGSLTAVKEAASPDHASEERPSSTDPDISSDGDDPSFDSIMETLNNLHVATAFRNEIYEVLSSKFNKIALEDPQCTIASWVRDTTIPNSSDTDLDECKSKILTVLTYGRQTLFWIWIRAHTDSSMLDVTDGLALLSKIHIWRVAFADTGILDFYLDALTEHADDTDRWIEPALKLIANCCAQSRSTKQAVFGRAPIVRLVGRLGLEGKADLALLVLHSICNGCELAEIDLEKNHQMTLRLLSGLEAGRFNMAFKDQICNFFGSMPDHVDHSKIEAAQLSILLDAPHKFDLSCDNIAEVTRLLTSLLEHEVLQDLIIKGGFPNLMTFFLNTYSTRISDARWQSTRHVDEWKKSCEDNDNMQKSRTALINAFCAIVLRCTDLAELRDSVRTMTRWLLSKKPQTQICAFILLGNLACKHSHFGCELLRDHDVGRSLHDCLVSATNREVLTSALGLLHNLATDSGNREFLGNANVLQALARCWSTQAVDIEVRKKALYQTRQLMCGCLSNIHHMISRQGKGTPSRAEGQAPILQLSAFFERTQDPVLQAEVGRIVAEAWRTINKGPHSQAILQYQSSTPTSRLEAEISSLPSNDQCDPGTIARCIRETLLNPDIPQFAESLLGLIRSNNEALVTEGWLTLALMAMWREGCLAICNRLYTDHRGDARSLACLLKAAIRNRGSLKGGSHNARYLLAQLQQQFADAEAFGEMLADFSAHSSITDDTRVLTL